MQDFYICKGSVNPVLRMELIKDGRYDFKKSYIDNAIQDCVVTFNMVDSETGLLKIGNEEANVVLAKETGCEEKYVLEYKWKERDTKKEGIYDAWFDIKFNGNIVEDGVDYPTGNLKVPIQEKLRIYVR